MRLQWGVGFGRRAQSLPVEMRVLLAISSVAFDASTFEAVNNRDKKLHRGEWRNGSTKPEEGVARCLTRARFLPPGLLTAADFPLELAWRVLTLRSVTFRYRISLDRKEWSRRSSS
jgi:hypothetical protein